MNSTSKRCIYYVNQSRLQLITFVVHTRSVSTEQPALMFKRRTFTIRKHGEQFSINKSVFRAALKSIMLTLSTRFRCKLISDAACRCVRTSRTTVPHIARVKRVRPIWAKQACSHPYCRLSFDQFIYIASGCSLQLS